MLFSFTSISLVYCLHSNSKLEYFPQSLSCSQYISNWTLGNFNSFRFQAFFIAASTDCQPWQPFDRCNSTNSKHKIKYLGNVKLYCVSFICLHLPSTEGQLQCCNCPCVLWSSREYSIPWFQSAVKSPWISAKAHYFPSTEGQNCPHVCAIKQRSVT